MGCCRQVGPLEQVYRDASCQIFWVGSVTYVDVAKRGKDALILVEDTENG